MHYNISFDICAGVITLVALNEMLFGRDMDRSSNRILVLLISMHLVSVVFDIWSSVCNSNPLKYSVMLRDFTNYIFLGVHTSEAAVFLWFLLEQLGLSKRMRRWQWTVLWLPEALMVLLPLLLNPVFREVFRYDENGIYIHGAAMPLLYIAADLYMVVCIVFAARNRNVLTLFQRRAAVLLLLLSVVPMLIQSIFMPHQLIEMFFQILGIYGYMQAVENTDEIRNPVTHALNRHVLARDFMSGFLDDGNVYAVVVKISQIEALRLYADKGSVFHSIRLNIVEWFRTNADMLGMKFYDCEKGIYVVLSSGADAESVCRRFTGRVEMRFKKTWETDVGNLTFPAQISLISFPNRMITAQDFFYIIMQPYYGSGETTVYADPEELLREFHRETEMSPKPGMHSEIQDSLESFLARIRDLSPAEKRVFDLYVAGYEVSEIPAQAFISINTVKKHNKSIYRKLGVGSREEIRLYVDLLMRCGREEELTV